MMSEVTPTGNNVIDAMQIVALKAIVKRLVAALKLVGRVDERGRYNTTGQVLIFGDQKREIGDAIKDAEGLVDCIRD
jgi:hypothetical protein